MELRRTLHIERRNPMEVFTDADCIIFRKYEVSCTFCGNENDVTLFKGKALCDDCRRELVAKAASPTV
ncbi:AbrB family transcriptional regulator (plasmid) [Alicyclobacillus dauci]|uniref:AbrB family transcriptional regulator n=1 Tax=Alicyclobacillus dauci TaxID=1475485 RepID=A0ABY6ZBS7_9BACL|nr:AbrB family transcriptional regulator [Alicyclobacillus dauci]WAH39506.1 AbrB family transcriptional regulator [Alicyclobacillus dauci]WAH39566.1 AbrB family transcriptional regulator [Alicyclobacillus dauci]